MTQSQRRAAMLLAASAIAFGAAAAWSLTTTDTGTLGDAHADALVVFGSPAEIDGTPSPMQLWRVNEAVAEYRRGIAPHIVFAGGAAANRFVESDVMAHEAIQQGVPPDAIVTERRSRTTVENLRGVSAIMQAHHWSTAELISSPDHLPRIAVLAHTAPFRWRLHAAPTPGRGRLSTVIAYAEEDVATLLLRTLGPRAEPLVHTVAICEHWAVFLPKWIVWKLRHHGTPSHTDTPEPESPTANPA